jgi:hypothetical protein
VRRVVHLDQACDGLLLEPLPRVALVDAGAGSELAGGLLGIPLTFWAVVPPQNVRVTSIC